MDETSASIFNIPAGQPFARILARHLLKGADTRKNSLSQTIVLLPTRRACRVLQDALTEESGGEPLLLPRIQPIGDLDEEELALSISAHTGQEDNAFNLLPAISPLRRQILLSRLVQIVLEEVEEEK